MALIQNPAALIADEPTTALDVIVQLEILELLESLKRTDGMAILLISHDFSVVFQLSDRIAVLYGGKLLEVGSADDVVLRPSHPYTVGLIDAVPRVDDPTRELHAIKGQFAPIAMGEAGCPFASRCPHVMDICRTAFPEETDLGNGHSVHCWLRSEG
jgi:oligopeptide/dipeptide ABC transporter ATP-binding protein